MTQARKRWSKNLLHHCFRRSPLPPIFLVLVIAGIAAGAWAHDEKAGAVPEGSEPVIALIIDDLGNMLSRGMRSVNLGGPVAMSFLPHAPHTRPLADAAYRQRKEVMLHLPMQSIEDHHLDEGGLTLDMDRASLVDTLEQNIEAVPHVSGINNHMGSLLTRQSSHMGWLMDAIRTRGDLFFVDSRTIQGTVARRLSVQNGIPTGDRDVFLDNRKDIAYIRQQFEELIERAMQRGAALGIGHPHPHTLAVLEAEIERLPERGVKLVPVSEYIQVKNHRRYTWRASLSP